MATQGRERFIRAQVAWMLASVVVLALLDALTLDLFFVASLVGFLIVVELTAPVNVPPAWRRRLRWITIGGLLGFGYIVLNRVLAILPPGVVP